MRLPFSAALKRFIRERPALATKDVPRLIIARTLQLLAIVTFTAGLATAVQQALAAGHANQHVAIHHKVAPAYVAAPDPFIADDDATKPNTAPSAAPDLPFGATLSAALQIEGVFQQDGRTEVLVAGPNGTPQTLTVGDHVDAKRTIIAISLDAVRLSDGSILPVFSQAQPYGAPALPPGAPYLVPALTNPYPQQVPGYPYGVPVASPRPAYAAPAATPQPYMMPTQSTPSPAPSPYGRPAASPPPPYATPSGGTR